MVTVPAADPGDNRGGETYELTVTAVTLEAERVIGVALRGRRGEDLPAWSAGAHIELVLPSGRVRQYSLCGPASDTKTYRVAVLLEPNGRGGSAELHGSPLVGRTVKVRGPRNHFELRRSRRYVFIAGGIGITPIIAMIRSMSDSAQWSLHYGGRSRTSMAFLAETVDIGGERTHLVPGDEHGLLDLDSALAGAGAETAIYCCGPPALLEAVERRRQAVAPAAQLHAERFAPAPAAQKPPRADGPSFEVELRRSNMVLTVPDGRSVLSVVRDVLPDVPYSCEEGYCGSCETRVLDGVAEHYDEILTQEERRAGKTMMICVSRARSGRLVLDL